VGFLHWDLGSRDVGEVVEITVKGNAVNVLLMDSSNFSMFSRDGSYANARGCQVRQSPVRLTVPTSGHWYVVLHTCVLKGLGSVSVRMLSDSLPRAALPE
jgi:hypothetical protein